ncbi:MAG: LamB/YcsF family protein [Acidobacteria bacterium]|nr:MAG: LamB/YcsF family protein [Acidobacteriota bacterium]
MVDRVDLNADVGESYGAFRIGCDEELLGQVTSANIACGWHAGDPLVMERTVQLAFEGAVGIGAHPGFPDLLGFGRRNLQISEPEAKAYVLYQIGALDAFVRKTGETMQHVKLHGAMYNVVSKDPNLASAVIAAIQEFDPDLILVGLSGSPLIKLAEERGLRVAHEAFADRAYAPDGSLVPRTSAGAMITDPAAAGDRALRMITEGIVQASDGQDVRIHADTICIHGDNPHAVSFARSVRSKLESAGIKIQPLRDFI